jgi:hypothetical protein
MQTVYFDVSNQLIISFHIFFFPPLLFWLHVKSGGMYKYVSLFDLRLGLRPYGPDAPRP